jgi:hypothetical protein
MASFEGIFDPYPHNMKKYAIIHTFGLIILLVSIYLFLIGVTNKYILTVDFYEKNGQPVSGIPDMASAVYQHVQQTIYLCSGIYLVAKLLVIAFILYTGLYCFEIKASFTDILRIVTQAEYLFLIPALVKVYWFYYYNTNASLEKWQNFYFLSAASVTCYIKPIFLYPLQTFNLFELAYWFVLAAGIRSVTTSDFDKSLRVVLSSYLPLLFLWMVIVAFFAMIYYPNAY